MALHLLAADTSPGSLGTLFTIVGTVAGALGALVAVFQLFSVQREAKKAQELAAHSVPPDSLETKLDRLTESMQESKHLVEQVSAELDARAVTAKRLKEEAESAAALAALNQEQADAVRRLLRSEMTTELATSRRRIFRDSLRIAIGSFVAGGLLSFLVTLLVHPLR